MKRPLIGTLLLALFVQIAPAQLDEARAALSAREYDRLLEICDRWVAEQDSATMDRASALTYRYIAHRSIGSLGAAESDAREVLQLMRGLRGDEHGDTLTALGNVAGVRMQRGDLLEAEALYREILAVQERQPQVGAAELARSINNLAVVLRRQGAWADAEAMFRRSHELAIDVYGEQHRTTVVALRNLARVLRALDRFDEARSALQAVLESYPPDDAVRISATLIAMAELELEAGEHARAEELATRAHELRTLALGADSAESARSAWMRARIVLARGDAGRALPLAREALEALQRLLGALHPDALRARVTLAEAEFALGDAAAALAVLKDAVESYELNLRSAAAGLDRATVDLPSPYPLLARAHAELGQYEAAWEAAELSHGKVLGEVMDLRLGKLSDAELSQRARLSQQLEEQRARLEALSVDAPEFASQRQQLLQSEAEWARFERELARQQGLSAADLPTLAQVARQLAADDLLIGWIDGWIWTLDATARLRFARCAQGGAVRELRAALLAARDAPAFESPLEDAPMRQLEAQVAARWFDPIWEQLRDRRRLWIIPHAELAGLPMAPLRDAHGVPFLDRFEIVLLPSASVWLRAAERPRLARPGSALFFGALPVAAPTHPRFARQPALRAASQEITRCAALHTDAQLLSGANASEEELRKLQRSGQLREFELLHFATHGLSDPIRPERSALMAVADNSASAASDGALSTVEIADTWQLAARLVVLSACETALGRPVPGEGYVGIAHGFFQAGARSLLISQWEVDDDATSLLMVEFYRRWRGEGLSSSRALAAAQRSVRERHPHPYFWAAFTLVGAAD